MMTDDEKDFELIERRLRERIESNLKGSLFKAYAVAGAAVAAVLGLTGYNLLSHIEDRANKGFDTVIADSKGKLETYVAGTRADLETLTGKLKLDLSKSDLMSDAVNTSLVKLQNQTETVKPILAKLQISLESAETNLATLSTKSAELSKVVENNRIQLRNSVGDDEREAGFPEQLKALNTRVEELANAVARLAEAGNQSTANSAVIASASRVAAHSEATSSAINNNLTRTVLFFQYNQIEKDTANDIAEKLRTSGIIVPDIDNEPMNNTRFRVVRFYNPEDEAEARRIANLSNQLITEAGLPNGDVKVEDYTFWKGPKLKPGNIELWLGEPKQS
ncbi:hypothetical protein VKY48_17140 [Endobacterium cereale]|nr:hypothetical protein [Endobacterium cereale]MEB2846159.1 hypothetical protein [Endobacterium cereale]